MIYFDLVFAEIVIYELRFYLFVWFCFFMYLSSCPSIICQKIIYSILNCLHIFYWASTEHIWVDSCSVYFFHSFYYSLLLLSIFLLIALCCDNYSFIVSLEIRWYKSSCPPLFFKTVFVILVPWLSCIHITKSLHIFIKISCWYFGRYYVKSINQFREELVS